MGCAVSQYVIGRCATKTRCRRPPQRQGAGALALAVMFLVTPVLALAARELPDPQITPGAINTQVNQQNIDYLPHLTMSCVVPRASWSQGVTGHSPSLLQGLEKRE